MVDVKGKSVFLSGPMTGVPYNNLPAFIEAHKMLSDHGAKAIFNPAFEWIHELERGEPEKSHEYYMRKCIVELTCSGLYSEDIGFGREGETPAKYDMLVRLDGWASRNGSLVESIVAKACGIQVVNLWDIEMGE